MNFKRIVVQKAVLIEWLSGITDNNVEILIFEGGDLFISGTNEEVNYAEVKAGEDA
jgi:hypothetical protein